MHRDQTCLQVDTLEAKAGRKGHIKLKGTLPLDSQSSAASQAGLHLDVHGLEVRSRNLYTGAHLRTLPHARCF